MQATVTMYTPWLRILLSASLFASATPFSLTAFGAGKVSTGRDYADCLRQGHGESVLGDTQDVIDACQRQFEIVPDVRGELQSSGDMIPNEDGSASFEFRVSNTRQDIIVTGFTVTVTFYAARVSPDRALATYHFSFRSPVPPQGTLLEYGRLDAKSVADLARRHKAAGLGSGPAALGNAVYTYSARTDTQVEGVRE
jgi:hypothetical protein